VHGWKTHDARIVLHDVVRIGSDANPGFDVLSGVKHDGDIVTMHARVQRTSGSGRILLLIGGMIGIAPTVDTNFCMLILMGDILTSSAGRCQIRNLNY